MAKIVVDKDTCTAHARRNLEAPDLFPLDDDGFVTVTARAIDDSQKPATELAIAACPERALRMETGDPS